MNVLGYAIFGVGLALQVLLVSRHLRKGLWRHYPFFFCYLSLTLLVSILDRALRMLDDSSYAQAFWLTHMVAAVCRFAVTWEVFRQTFPREVRLRRLAAAIFAGVLLMLAFVLYLMGADPGVHLIADFMRKIGLCVAVSLLTILALARYYAVSLGRNLWGMAIGLLVLTSTYIADFAAIDISPAFQPIWRQAGAIAFVLMLCIWVVTLWSYYPNPKPVASDASAREQALSSWEKRWASVGTAIRRAAKP